MTRKAKGKIIGERFRALREDDDLKGEPYTQKELAKILNISNSRISAIENGRDSASLTELIAYHNKYNVPVDYLLGYCDNKEYNNVEIGKKLGLSDKTITTLEKWNTKNPHDNLIFLLNYLFESGLAKDFFIRLHRFIYGDVEKFTIIDVKNNQEYNRSYIKIIENTEDSGNFEAHAESSTYDRKINANDLNTLHELTLINAMRDIKLELKKHPKKYRNSLENFSIGDWF